MALRPQFQSLISLISQVQQFNCDGGLCSYLNEEGRGMTLLALFDGRKPHSFSAGPDAERVFRQLSRTGPPIAVLGFCGDGQVPLNLPAGAYAGAVLIRPAKDNERPAGHDSQQPVTSLVALRPVMPLGHGLVFAELPNPASYLEIIWRLGQSIPIGCPPAAWAWFPSLIQYQ